MISVLMVKLLLEHDKDSEDENLSILPHMLTETQI